MKEYLAETDQAITFGLEKIKTGKMIKRVRIVER